MINPNSGDLCPSSKGQVAHHCAICGLNQAKIVTYLSELSSKRMKDAMQHPMTCVLVENSQTESAKFRECMRLFCFLHFSHCCSRHLQKQLTFIFCISRMNKTGLWFDSLPCNKINLRNRLQTQHHKILLVQHSYTTFQRLFSACRAKETKKIY